MNIKNLLLASIMIFSFAACSDDDKSSVSFEENKDVNLTLLEKWSYEVDLNVKSDGVWSIKTEGS